LKLQKKVIKWPDEEERNRMDQGLNKQMVLSIVLA